MEAQAQDDEETLLPPDDRRARLDRYVARDKLLREALAAFLVRQLRNDRSFLADYERALLETDPHIACQFLFTEGEAWEGRGHLKRRQKAIKLPPNELLPLEEAVLQILPLLRRGKIPAVARAHSAARLRAAADRPTPGP